MTPEQAIKLRIKTSREIYYYYKIMGTNFLNHISYSKYTKNKYFKNFIK